MSDSSFTIISDSREKKPYTFNQTDCDVLTEALETGDYTIEGLEDKFCIERKTLDDFLKSITWDRDRFEREVIRAEDMFVFVVLIEANRSDITSWNYRRDVHPNSVIGTIETWERKYNVEFKWGSNREQSEDTTIKLLTEWYETYQNMMR